MGAAVRVKICGVRTVADAVAAARAGADFVGLNFHPPSPRRVDLDTARAIVRAVPDVACVGVFVDRPAAEIAALVRQLGLAVVQLHGDEPPEACRGLGCRTIKALRARPGADVLALATTYDTDWLLLDAWVEGVPGGTGVRVDPATARSLPRERLFLAGGLRVDNVADVVRTVRPFAVDVASGVETAPGVKDHDAIAEFIRRAKAA